MMEKKIISLATNDFDDNRSVRFGCTSEQMSLAAWSVLLVELLVTFSYFSINGKIK